MFLKTLINARLFNLKLGLYQFSPGIITTIVTAALLYLMFQLGSWQWNKGKYREFLEDTVTSRMTLDPVGIELLPTDELERKYLPVRVTGRFDSEHQFLHDNRIAGGRSGYHVYTPFISDTGKVLLINRGWVPLGRTRDDLPDVSVTTGRISFTGLVDSVPEKGVVLGDFVNEFTGWPLVLQYMDHVELESMTEYRFEDMIVWMSPDAEHGYYRQIPALDLESNKNIGYAFQWLALSTALLIIYVLTNIKRSGSSGAD